MKSVVLFCAFIVVSAFSQTNGQKIPSTSGPAEPTTAISPEDRERFQSACFRGLLMNQAFSSYFQECAQADCRYRALRSVAEISSVEVIISSLGWQDNNDHAFQKGTLGTRVEMRLRQAGIKITHAALDPTVALYFVVTEQPVNGQRAGSLSCQISVYDYAYCPSNNVAVHSPIWQHPGFFCTYLNKPHDKVMEDYTEKLVDALLNDWFTANPPKSPAQPVNPESTESAPQPRQPMQPMRPVRGGS